MWKENYENVLLCGTLMETICFDDHYPAFTVSLHPDRVFKGVNVNELCHFKPSDEIWYNRFCTACTARYSNADVIFLFMYVS